MRVPVPIPGINIGASQGQRCHPAKEKDMLKIDLPKAGAENIQEPSFTNETLIPTPDDDLPF